MRTGTRLLAAMALAAGLAGCGGGSKEIHFPVDHSKTLPSLTTDEAKAMCDAMIGSAKDAMSFSCLATAVTKKFGPGGSEQTCQTSYQECMNKLQSQPLNCTLVDTSKLQGCNVTVGEYETCSNDALATLDNVASRMSCGMSISDLQSLQSELKNVQPASCKALAPKCPTIFGSDDSPP